MTLRARLLSPLRSDQAPTGLGPSGNDPHVPLCVATPCSQQGGRQAGRFFEGMTMIVRTFVPIMERAGFQQIGREPAEAIELDDAEQLALIDTLIRRLHMRTGAEAPALPIGIEDEPADRREWFGIVVQSCGEAGTFFQRAAQAQC